MKLPSAVAFAAVLDELMARPPVLTCVEDRRALPRHVPYTYAHRIMGNLTDEWAVFFFENGLLRNELSLYNAMIVLTTYGVHPNNIIHTLPTIDVMQLPIRMGMRVQLRAIAYAIKYALK